MLGLLRALRFVSVAQQSHQGFVKPRSLPSTSRKDVANVEKTSDNWDSNAYELRDGLQLERLYKAGKLE